ncbi:MAG: hypothetical protein KDD60_07765, partial [Bdellovibrionales bacterium]|nr:hypothetical protein [Bdellovibrionales bacterium]
VRDEALYGTFNVGTGRELSVIELFNTMKAVSESASSVRFDAPRGGEQQRSAISSELLQSKSSWQLKTDLQTGLRETIHWFRVS